MLPSSTLSAPAHSTERPTPTKPDALSTTTDPPDTDTPSPNVAPARAARLPDAYVAANNHQIQHLQSFLKHHCRHQTHRPMMRQPQLLQSPASHSPSDDTLMSPPTTSIDDPLDSHTTGNNVHALAHATDNTRASRLDLATAESRPVRPMSLQHPPQMTHAQCDHPTTHQSWTPQTPRHQQSHQQTVVWKQSMNQSRPSTHAVTHARRFTDTRPTHSARTCLRKQTQTLQHSQPRPRGQAHGIASVRRYSDPQHAQPSRR